MMPQLLIIFGKKTQQETYYEKNIHIQSMLLP